MRNVHVVSTHAGHRVAHWLVRTLPRGRSRTLRLKLNVPTTARGSYCITTRAAARHTRGAAVRYCTAVVTAPPQGLRLSAPARGPIPAQWRPGQTRAPGRAQTRWRTSSRPAAAAPRPPVQGASTAVPRRWPQRAGSAPTAAARTAFMPSSSRPPLGPVALLKPGSVRLLAVGPLPQPQHNRSPEKWSTNHGRCRLIEKQQSAVREGSEISPGV